MEIFAPMLLMGLIVCIAMYYVIRRAVRDALRDHDQPRLP
jgi:hypothetical protein